MPKTITIEVSDEIGLLLEKDELLKKIVEEHVKDNIKEIVMKFLIAEELTKDVKISEEEILEMDRKIKREAWEKLKRKWRL